MRSATFLSRAGATTMARLAAVGMLLGVMAIGSRRLGADEFGLWTIFYTVMNFASSLDFGFRYSVGNRLAALKANESRDDDRRQTFLAIFHLELLLGLIGAAVCFGGLSLVDWASVFHFQTSSVSTQAQRLIPLIGAMLMLNQPLSIAGSAFFADQQITLVSAFSMAQSLVLLAAYWLGTFHSFFTLVVTFFSVYLGTGAILTGLLFIRMKWRWQWFPWSSQFAVIRSLWKQSMDFSLLSVSAMAAATVGPLLAGVVGSIRLAGDFTLIQRFFNLLVAVHLAALAPLAPAYTLHARQGNWAWVRDRHLFCLRVIWPLLFIGGGVSLLLAHPLLLKIWSGHWLVDFPLAGLLALTAILGGLTNTFSILLNSLGVIRVQAVLSVAMLAPVLLLPVVFGKSFGTVGIALASVICTIPTCIVNWRSTRLALIQETLRV